MRSGKRPATHEHSTNGRDRQSERCEEIDMHVHTGRTQKGHKTRVGCGQRLGRGAKGVGMMQRDDAKAASDIRGVQLSGIGNFGTSES
jgi:hypothetical protein